MQVRTEDRAKSSWSVMKAEDSRLEYLKLFAAITEDYEERYLTDSPKQLINDWWMALQFFFSRVFYQGRRDDISAEVERRVIEVLSNYFRNKVTRDSEFKKLEKGKWNGLRGKLSKKIGKGKMGRQRDISLTIDAMKFISRLPNKNIATHSVRKIKSGDICVLSKELQDLESIGPKTSSLYLRDIVILFKLENSLQTEQHYQVVMPVDTWIRQITKSLGFSRQDAEDEDIIKDVIEICRNSNISPIRINQGIWYVGTHAFELCFDRVVDAIEETRLGRPQEASTQLSVCIGILKVLSSLEKDQDERSRLEDRIKRLASLRPSL